MAQPIYVTLTSSGSSPIKQTNWWNQPQEITFAVIPNTSGSSYAVSVCLEDPTGTFPSPVSSSPTMFTVFQGSSNAIFSLGSSVTVPITEPIAGYQFTLNSVSSVGAKATFIMMQSGVA